MLGAWAGLTGFRETEWNLAEAPGENLYAWYTTALAAVVALRVGSQRQQRRPRLLLIGLGGGSLATFFGHHYGSSVEIDVVERSAPVVHAAETYFGLRDHEAAADDADSGEAGDAVPSGELPNGTRVQVHGLVNAVAHNGKVGSVAAWVPARGRFEVSLDKGKTIFVKMANLRQTQHCCSVCRDCTGARGSSAAGSRSSELSRSHRRAAACPGLRGAPRSCGRAEC